MQHFYIRKAGIAALKCGFVAFGLLAIWLLGGIAENLGPWWLYILASVGSFAVGVVLLGAALTAEDELAAEIARSQSVPVRKIERRSSRRHSA